MSRSKRVRKRGKVTLLRQPFSPLPFLLTAGRARNEKRWYVNVCERAAVNPRDGLFPFFRKRDNFWIEWLLMGIIMIIWLFQSAEPTHLSIAGLVCNLFFYFLTTPLALPRLRGKNKVSFGKWWKILRGNILYIDIKSNSEVPQVLIYLLFLKEITNKIITQ